MEWQKDILVPLATALGSALIAFVVAHVQAGRTARREVGVRQRDLSIEVTKLLLNQATAQAAARRFAVGVAKITVDALGNDKGKILFIPINSRVTIGRDSSNDICLGGDTLSRFHCGLVSEGERVFLEDYCSTNGTRVGGQRLEPGATRELVTGDEIELPSYTILFRAVHRSSLLFR